VLEPGFKQLESREESKTNASDISIFFHFDIALAEPDKQQSPQSVGDKQRVLWSPVILVGDTSSSGCCNPAGARIRAAC
jgi:hypothetical protein